ncbi:hypothetical protein [Paraburkholderia sediminicola]|uniref:hypothetical protein n=1 Tax=Paraburkholderia sediminicola TaxID=458836 RepID=UPI001581BDF1|nr:hypothetical protein [Paraburkholderia sediminicola]
MADELSVGLSAEEQLLNHPLLNHTVIRTDPCNEAYLEGKRRLCFGFNGFSLLGERGMGLKSALVSFKLQLLQDFPSIAVAEIVLRRDAPQTCRARWQALLGELGHGVLGGSIEEMRRRVLWMLEERLYGSPHRHLALFIRNIEYLDPGMTNILLDVSDALGRRGFKLFTIGCGNLSQFSANLANAGDLAAKDVQLLLGSTYVLRSLNTEQDLATILDAIDTTPLGRDDPRSWGAVFLPEAYQGGFRLKNESEILLSAIVKTPSRNVTVHNLFDAIRWVLVMNARRDSRDFALVDRAWEDALFVVRATKLTFSLEDPPDGA